MSILVKDIQVLIENFAPKELAQEWDNIGLVAGKSTQKVSKILLALDLLDAVIDEAVEIGADLIITHHPPFLRPLMQINDNSPIGNRLLKLIESGIGLYVAHTNFDATNGGMNDILANILELENIEPICEQPNGAFMGRGGHLKTQMTVKQLSVFVQKKLNTPYAVYCGEWDEIVTKVAVVGGSAANDAFFKSVKQAGCNAFITADIRYHNAQKALEMGLNLIDATHFGSEVVFANSLAKYIEKNLKIECVVSKIDGQVFKNGGV